MKTLRLVATFSVLCTLVLLALFSKSFWWFLEVRDWQAVFADFGSGKGQLTTACLWATIHGTLSIIIGTLVCVVDSKPFHSPKRYGLSLFGCCATSAAVLALADIGSGWWMLIEGGKYISLCYAAFLQPFLIGYLLVVLSVPAPVNKAPRLPFKANPCC